MHAEHPAAALEQEPVELGVVLIGLAAEERLDVQAVRLGDQPGHRDELVLALEPDQERARLRRLAADAEVGQDFAELCAAASAGARWPEPSGPAAARSRVHRGGDLAHSVTVHGKQLVDRR